MKTISIEEFNIEKDAKNEAYYFILSNDLYGQFTDFCKNYRSKKHHTDCVDYFASEAANELISMQEGDLK